MGAEVVGTECTVSVCGSTTRYCDLPCTGGKKSVHGFVVVVVVVVVVHSDLGC